ncbi:hypothetical protein [Acuticoccus kandeliae]|uniref:hypothetical protein n=1 Tax=Acuticoccus kandeliae TaxID=2073160 RepID=UPI0014765950|nr:hypothetical protein [Acuticoccus kandeliae]
MCLIVGLLTVWTPLPTGIPLIAIGTVLAVSVSSTARTMLKSMRHRSGIVDRGLVIVETKTGRNMATMLKRTRPLSRKLAARSALQAANAALKSPRARRLVDPSDPSV